MEPQNSFRNHVVSPINSEHANIFYYNIVNQLRTKLHNLDQNLKTSKTDDRPPTFYFKIKTQKENFPSTLTPYTNISHFDPALIPPFARPITNHSSSPSTLASRFLRPLLSPIIENHPHLASDVFSAMKQLSVYGPPPEFTTMISKVFTLTHHTS